MASETVKTSGSKRFSDLPDSDAACAGCGYLLRGQPRDGRCPECGLSVADSAARVADRLMATVAMTGATDERRRSDLRWGPWLILAGAACWVVGFLTPHGLEGLVVRTVAQVMAWGLAGAGAFVSVRHRLAIGPWRKSYWLSLIVRTAAVVCVIAPILILVSLYPVTATAQPSGVRVPLMMFDQKMATLLGETTRWAGIVGSIAFFLYAWHVARLVRQRSAAVGCLVVVVVLIIEFLWTAIPVIGGRGNVFRLYNANAMLDVPVIATGIGAASADAWRSAGGSILIRKIMEGLFKAGAWWSVLTLVQLAFLPGRKITPDEEHK